MELGQEWDITELVLALQELCIESGNIPIWIDQLCIAQQKQDEVRSTLARIPDIYRTLDVVALVPGGNCECKVNALAVLEHSGMTIDKPTPLDMIDMSEYRDTALPCFNSLAIHSWFTRLWTRQEFMYALRIRLRWTSGETFPCVRTARFHGHNIRDYLLSPEQVQGMVPAARLFHERFMREEGVENGAQTLPDDRLDRHHIAQHRMNGASATVHTETFLSMKENGTVHFSNINDSGFMTNMMLLRFLDGESICSKF